MVGATFKKRIVYQRSVFALTSSQAIVFDILLHSLIAYHSPFLFFYLLAYQTY